MLSFFSFDLIARGGPIIIVLIICSILSLAIVIERLWYLRHKKIMQVDKLMEIEIAVKKQDVRGALEWARAETSPMLRIAEVGLINSDRPKKELKLAIEEAGRMEVPNLEKFLTTLNTIAVISPLLGLLGTVLGMIHVFDKIVEQGAKDPAILAGGISEALLTTATGLTVAIPTLICYNLISKSIENLVTKMEHHSITLFELLTGNLT
ncbi:MAG: MotA/TolQ/ExbB proton channel family protein [Deltaproteobacteria bacterium]|jgi:biopolymer transport protein ExbB|nr:MotA/TolQ/ExbB proton channel family protein [Deltaproteobacteria bacterium]